jgi:iron uptake system component EfeO
MNSSRQDETPEMPVVATFSMPAAGARCLLAGLALATLVGVAATGCGAGVDHEASATAPSPRVSDAAWRSDSQLTSAVDRYAAYVDTQIADLVSGTKAFAAAVEAGDTGRAKRLYPQARIHYERVEPVAEVWGALDVQIDGRIDAFTSEAAFTGFHRLEQELWGSPSLPTPSAGSSLPSDASGIARLLVAHVEQLQRLARGHSYTPLQLTSGATELLAEITASKVTGEEERYSHLDLVDLEGNLQGSAEAVDVFAPFLRIHAAALFAQIRQRARAAAAAMAALRQRPGDDGSGYPSFTTLTHAQTRQLTAAVVALQSSVSLTPSVIGG